MKKEALKREKNRCLLRTAKLKLWLGNIINNRIHSPVTSSQSYQDFKENIHFPVYNQVNWLSKSRRLFVLIIAAMNILFL